MALDTVGRQHLGKSLDLWFAPQLFRRTPEQCVPSPGAPATAERRAMEDYQVLEGNTAPACVCIDPPTSQRLPSPPNRDRDAYTCHHSKRSSFGEITSAGQAN